MLCHRIKCYAAYSEEKKFGDEKGEKKEGRQGGSCREKRAVGQSIHTMEPLWRSYSLEASLALDCLLKTIRFVWSVNVMVVVVEFFCALHTVRVTQARHPTMNFHISYPRATVTRGGGVGLGSVFVATS
jgi:hypothetical protein